MAIKDQVMQDMKAAMTARDKERLGAIRLIRAELLKAEKDTAAELDEAREIAILQKMLKQRRDSVEQFEKGGREDLAARERQEAEVIQAYLPEGLSEEEIAAVIDKVLTGIESPAPNQAGKIIGQVMGQLKATGKPFDGKQVNEMVRSKLAS